MVSRDAASWTAMTTLVEQNETNKQKLFKRPKKEIKPNNNSYESYGNHHVPEYCS
jgi:hypothetical protein